MIWSLVRAGESVIGRRFWAFQFDVMGATRTYWHFYIGFGLYITALLLLQAVLLWQLASLVRVDPSRVRPLLGTLSVGGVVGTVVIWTFIFAVPALFSLACTGWLTMAFIAARPHTATNRGSIAGLEGD
jgi:hypothetical protein